MTFYTAKELVRLELFIIKETVVGGIEVIKKAKSKGNTILDLLHSTYEGPEGDTRKGNWYTFIRSMYESDRRDILKEG